jgi:SAM-dependent methyltransferase
MLPKRSLNLSAHEQRAQIAWNIVDASCIDMQQSAASGKIVQRGVAIEASQVVHTRGDAVSMIKEWVKRFPGWYAWCVWLFSPVHGSSRRRDRLVREALALNHVVVNLASGPTRMHDSVINVDLFSYYHVDVVADATRICFMPNSVDLVINEACLEHIYAYHAVIAEMYRMLKKGGRAYVVVPFMQGFHASPHDYHRFTHVGLTKNFESVGFVVKRVGIAAGPASAFVWVAHEMFAVLFCCGSKRLYEILSLMFMAVLSPIKFLDILLVHLPGARNAASAFFVEVEK